MAKLLPYRMFLEFFYPHFLALFHKKLYLCRVKRKENNYDYTIKRVCHKSMTHPFSQKAPTCKLLSCSLRKFSVLFTTKPKLSQARALSFCKKVVSLQKTFIEYGKDTNKIRN